jgi:hypothetical protein
MEEKIRFHIDLVKNRIASLEQKLEAQQDAVLRAFYRGSLTNAKLELETLEDLLLSWEVYQQKTNEGVFAIDDFSFMFEREG